LSEVCASIVDLGGHLRRDLGCLLALGGLLGHAEHRAELPARRGALSCVSPTHAHPFRRRSGERYEIRLDRDTLDVVGCGPLTQRRSDPLGQHHHSDHQLEDCAGVSHEAPTAADASTNAQGHVASCRLNGVVLKSLECSGQEPRTTDQQDIRTVHESSFVPMFGHSSSLNFTAKA
jgi:hypothetical protein